MSRALHSGVLRHESFWAWLRCGLVRLLCAVCFLCSLGFLGGARDALAQPPSLSELTVDNRQGVATVRFGLRLEGVDELARRLREGEVVAVVSRATLSQRRDWVWDAPLAEREMRAIIRYDALGKEFALTRPGLPGLPGAGGEARDAALGGLLGRSLSELSLELGPAGMLTKGVRYQLELKVSVERADAPPWLKRALFFWSWNVFPPARYALEFVY